MQLNRANGLAHGIGQRLNPRVAEGGFMVGEVITKCRRQ